MNGLIPDRVSMETLLGASFRDFHVRGFDYLCLQRSPPLTIKAYFFDGDVAKLPEVVMPHDHRYCFETIVANGAVQNRSYQETVPEHPRGRPYEQFDYLTPLNGGDGFTWRRRAFLRLAGGRRYERGERYWQSQFAIHTINILAPETVLLLYQGPDLYPVWRPTSAFRAAGARTSPSLSGLYNTMTPDHALARLGQLCRVLGVAPREIA